MRTTYYDNQGGKHHVSQDCDIETAKAELARRKLCVAVLDNGSGQLSCVTMGRYMGLLLIHEGKAFFINSKNQ